MSCPPEATPQLATYAAGWRERLHQESTAAADWRARITARLPALTRMLVEDFGARRVLLFGSLARAEAGPGSDVDLLVDGLASERLIEATVRAERLLCEAHADLVPAEWVRPEVLARTRQEGVLLHDG